jgi:hypothetical protein
MKALMGRAVHRGATPVRYRRLLRLTASFLLTLVLVAPKFAAATTTTYS